MNIYIYKYKIYVLLKYNKKKNTRIKNIIDLYLFILTIFLIYII